MCVSLPSTHSKDRLPIILRNPGQAGKSNSAIRQEQLVKKLVNQIPGSDEESIKHYIQVPSLFFLFSFHFISFVVLIFGSGFFTQVYTFCPGSERETRKAVWLVHQQNHPRDNSPHQPEITNFSTTFVFVMILQPWAV